MQKCQLFFQIYDFVRKSAKKIHSASILLRKTKQINKIRPRILPGVFTFRGNDKFIPFFPPTIPARTSCFGASSCNLTLVINWRFRISRTARRNRRNVVAYRHMQPISHARNALHTSRNRRDFQALPLIYSAAVPVFDAFRFYYTCRCCRFFHRQFLVVFIRCTVCCRTHI